MHYGYTLSKNWQQGNIWYVSLECWGLNFASENRPTEKKWRGLQTHLWCLDGLAWNGIGSRITVKESLVCEVIRKNAWGWVTKVAYTLRPINIFSLSPISLCPMSRIGSGGGFVQSIQRNIASALKCWISGGGVARNISNKSILKTYIYCKRE